MPEVAIEDLSIYSDEPKKVEKDVKVRSHKIITFLRESRDWVVGLPQRPTDEKLRLTALVISPLAGVLAVRNNPNLAIKYLTPVVATTTVSLATFPSATMGTMGSGLKFVGDGYDKMVQNQQRLLKEWEIMKQKQLELQQELQRIQDELNEKAAIAEAERIAKEAEILRIETEKAAIEERKQLELQKIAEAEFERIQAEAEIAEKLALEAEIAEKLALEAELAENSALEAEMAEKLALEAEIAEKAALEAEIAQKEAETLEEVPVLEEQAPEVLEVQNVAFERQGPLEEVIPAEEPLSIKEEVAAEESVCEAPIQVESVEESSPIVAEDEVVLEKLEETVVVDPVVTTVEDVKDVQADELVEPVSEEPIAEKLEEIAAEEPQCPFMQEISEEILLEDVSEMEEDVVIDECLIETVEAKPLEEIAADEPRAQQIDQCPFMQGLSEEMLSEDLKEVTSGEQAQQCPFMQEVSEEAVLEDVEAELVSDEVLFETVEAVECPVEEVQNSSVETPEVTTLEVDSSVGEIPEGESREAAVEQLKMDLREVVAEFERENFGEEVKVAAVSETVEEIEEPIVLDDSLFEQITPSSDENVSTENVSNLLEQLMTPPSEEKSSNVDFGQSLKEDEEMFPERSRD